MRCLKSSKNQIQPGKNTITVAGGSNSAKALDDMKMGKGRLKWNINAAYIMNDDNDKSIDVGIAELKRPDTFFNPRFVTGKLGAVLKESEILNAPIVPICLGSSKLNEKVDMTDIEIKGVGWGNNYEEMTLDSYIKGIRDPVYSSCMTNQASPNSWRFQNCDMKRMKQPLKMNFKNTWACEKIQAPPEYEVGQEERCKKYFSEFKKMIHGKGPTINLPDRILDDIDVINIDETNSGDKLGSNIKETCYNPEQLSKSGWCYLKNSPEKAKLKKDTKNWQRKEAWGICSSSCDSKLMEVNNFLI